MKGLKANFSLIIALILLKLDDLKGLELDLYWTGNGSVVFGLSLFKNRILGENMIV